MKSWIAHLLCAVLLAATSASAASAAEPNLDCTDAEVSAVIVKQTPTARPPCKDCVVLFSVWILDLDVKQVDAGSAPLGPLTVLSVESKAYPTDGVARRWLLRRNTASGFNVTYPPEEGRLAQCPADAAPVRPYLRLKDGQTLDDLRRAIEDRDAKGS